MKTIKYILSTGIACVFLTACNDSFLEKYPETKLNEEAFFQTPKDMEIYLNNLYKDLSYQTDDIYSDNLGNYSGTNEVDNMLRGSITPQNVGGWSKGEDEDWYNLRKANVLLANAHKPQGDRVEINHYIGVARFFRANFYFKMLKRYGAAPWYSRPLTTSDPDLYKGMDSRELVADSIMADLQFAVENIKAIDSRTYINKWVAYSLMARFALHEGTYRKYHEEINLTASANNFLEKAAWAANEIVKSNLFEITGQGAEGYRNLFCVGDLKDNKEIIMFADYDRTLGRSNNTSSVLDWQWNLSRSLADSYLKLDGTPISADPTYATKLYTEMFDDRDPRMAETIMPAGFITSAGTTPHLTKPDFGGLPQLKFYPRVPELNGGYDSNYNDLPIFRYGETLLILAEAKAELGTLTQPDLDATINKLRDRVEMPHIQLSALIDDPVITAQYPNVTGANAKVILEIRRERRVELACEGFRYQDLMRWKAGKLLEVPAEGIYIPKFGAYDVTGDGTNDIAILKSPTDKAGLTDAELEKLNIYTLADESGKESNFYLSEGTKGYIRFVKNKNIPPKFEEPKCYYLPIPFTEIQKNPNLEQPTGWK